MKSEIVIEQLEKVLRNISGVDIDVEKMKARLKNPQKLDSFLSNGPVVCSIFNHSTFKFDYISPNVEQMLGLSAGELMQLKYQEFLRQYFHPQDLQIVTHQLLTDVLKFISENTKSDALRISIHYNYRMQTTAGNWIKVEQQTTPIKLSESGNILLDQSFYTPAGKADFDEAHSIELSIYLMGTDGLYKRALSKTYSNPHTDENRFTQRELDVLELLAQGKTSKEIGQELFISKSTVITHRKNMLEKFGLKNTSELIAYAFKSGIIQS